MRALNREDFMPPDVKTQSLAELLMGCFNGNPATTLAGIVDRTLTINSLLMGGDRRANALATAPIPTLIESLRTRFPGTRFRSDALRSTDNGFSFTLQGEFAGPELAGPALTVQCTCRVRLVQDKISELWFEVDEYSLLQQQGRICSAPGEAVAAARAANQQAVDALSQLLRTRGLTADLLDAAARVHANIELYKDISTGIITETRRLEGTGTKALDEVLALIRGRFQDPVELALGNGISQGCTTTFKGKIRAKIGASKQRYNIVCGFMSPHDRVTECWICITPPPTLMECLT